MRLDAEKHYRLKVSVILLSYLVWQQSGLTATMRNNKSDKMQKKIEISVSVEDTPNDAGNSLTVGWNISLSREEELATLLSYEIQRSTKIDGIYKTVAVIAAGRHEFVDTSKDEIIPQNTYYYRIKAILGDGREIISPPSDPAVPTAQWFHTDRTSMLFVSVLLAIFILTNIRRARAGRQLYIRPIAGINAVDEAIGRATEMGKPVLYIPGIMDMDDIQTIASMVILSRVARLTAEYDTKLLIPTSRSVVMSTAQEVVREAYLQAGRPDAYREQDIRYLTDDQFGYVAGVDGIMMRERPAANFFLGSFYAESLILAETGASTGAIQIAGTAMPAQLPFFITACDYTLIGEELFAASAYLSREPLLLGSLKGQDWGKLIFMILIILGVLSMTIGKAFDIPILLKAKELLAVR